MNLGWQDITVAAVCVAAALYVARAVWKSMTSRALSGCGTACGKCADSRPKPVIQIEAPRHASNDQ